MQKVTAGAIGRKSLAFVVKCVTVRRLLANDSMVDARIKIAAFQGKLEEPGNIAGDALRRRDSHGPVETMDSEGSRHPAHRRRP